VTGVQTCALPIFAYGLHMTFMIASIVAVAAMAASLNKGRVRPAGEQRATGR
jgi:hypothetical protein